jgi:hypothetical protein
VEAFARSRHPGRFAVDDEIRGGQVSRRTEGGHLGDRRRGAEDHRSHADRQRKEFVVLVARVHFAVRFDDRGSAVSSVTVRHNGQVRGDQRDSTGVGGGPTGGRR